MSAMVMCPDNAPTMAMYQRYPSPPVNYPTAFNGFGYGTPGTQHPQDYQQFPPVADPTVHQAWYNAVYGTRTDDWGYGAAPVSSGAMTSTPTGMGTYSYRNTGLDYSQNPGGPLPASESPGDTSSSSSSAGSPTNKQLRPPYDWMKKAAYQSAPASGKTRTKDKYRVVYSDHQRLELEKEFHYSRYITIRRKAELAQTLALSERQVKIWFQNRRAKERKINKKREDNPAIMKHPSDLADFQDDNKHNVQHMNMQIPAHAQHQVQCQSPTSPHQMHVPHPGYSSYGHEVPVQHGMQQTQSTLSPSGHMTMHGQYQPNGHMIPISPMGGHDSISPNPCPVSPVNIKTDIDANDAVSS